MFLLDDVDAQNIGLESVQDIPMLRPLVQVPGLVHEADEEVVVPPPRSCVFVLHRADVGLACGQLFFFGLRAGLVGGAL